MSSSAVRMSERNTSNEQPESVAMPQWDHQQVATLAYQLWHERGCPEGSPEVDWFQAQVLQATDRHNGSHLNAGPGRSGAAFADSDE